MKTFGTKIMKVGIGVCLCGGMAFAAPWKFGLIADTQWPSAATSDSLSGYKNPNSVAVDIINQVNREFINQGVKFVIAVGDVTDNGSNLALDTRATYAQALYNAGIAFYPLRGNHESSYAAANEFKRIFPQTANGANNATPADAFVYTDSANLHPAVKTGGSFTVGSGFSSPGIMPGLSYSFTFNNATFVLLDQFTRPDSSASTGMNTIDSQQTWINGMLSGRPANTHAFVFGHKGLITENHADILFSTDEATGRPTDDTAGANAFINSLAANNVHYYIGGHDHIHNRARVRTSGGVNAFIEDIILASDSYKFYKPVKPSNDSKYDSVAFGFNRETEIAQDYARIGYYIVTVDSARVLIDYYAVPSGQTGGVISAAPALTGNWVKRETFGYSLNGQEFAVPQGGSYTTVIDSFGETRAQILGGTNASTDIDSSGRHLTQIIGTGWQSVNSATTPALLSNIVTLFGMAPIGSSQTATYTLSLRYNASASATDLIQGGIALALRDSAGAWKNAVDGNAGGTKNFVLGPWMSSHTLGTWGVDTVAKTAWAVINSSGDFVVSKMSLTKAVKFIFTSDNHYGITRPRFHQASNVDAQIVNRAMIRKMNALPSMTVPADTGVLAGSAVGTIEYLVSCGDFANRQEMTSGVQVQRDSLSWMQFYSDFHDSITLLSRLGAKPVMLLSPGNHDISNAIGYTGTLVPATDPTSMTQVYNLMLGPSTPLTNATFDYATDKINYSRNIAGIHFMFVNFWPDSANRVWMAGDLAGVNATTPVVIFTHSPPTCESKNFTNPNGTHTINSTDLFQNLLVEQLKDGSLTINDSAKIEMRGFAAFLQQHPNIKAYFNGHDNYNEFGTWTGPDNNVALPYYRVDSPMKGTYSKPDETRLSFQFIAIDSAAQKMTVREVLWNPDSTNVNAPSIWGASKTISLAVGGVSNVHFTKGNQLVGNDPVSITSNRSAVKITYNAIKTPVSIRITTVNGRTIRSFTDSGAGRCYTWNYVRDGVSQGVYFVNVSAGGYMKNARVYLVR